MAEQNYFGLSVKASWEDVVAYLKGKYKLEVVGDKVRFGFRFKDDRTQVVVVGHEDKEDRMYVVITSRVGFIAPARLPKVLEKMAAMIYGSLIKMGEEYFLKVSLDMNHMPLEEMDQIIGFVTSLADNLEKEFVGGDEN